jgi:hypothetical protein
MKILKAFCLFGCVCRFRFFLIREVYVMKPFDDATSFCNEGAYTVVVVCVAT